MQAPSAWLRDPSLLRRLVRAESADAVLEILEGHFGQQQGGVLTSEEGAELVMAALEAGNADLAFGMLEAMRAAGMKARVGGGGHDWRWRWTPPDVKVYAALVRGLAASLRVGEAIDVVGQVRRRGLPKGEEVKRAGDCSLTAQSAFVSWTSELFRLICQVFRVDILLFRAHNLLFKQSCITQSSTTATAEPRPPACLPGVVREGCGVPQLSQQIAGGGAAAGRRPGGLINAGRLSKSHVCGFRC